VSTAPARQAPLLLDALGPLHTSRLRGGYAIEKQRVQLRFVDDVRAVSASDRELAEQGAVRAKSFGSAADAKVAAARGRMLRTCSLLVRFTLAFARNACVLIVVDGQAVVPLVLHHARSRSFDAIKIDEAHAFHLAHAYVALDGREEALSMHRTLYKTFGLPPLNMFDALASDLTDAFTTKPDFRPYQVRKVDPRIFDPEKAKDPKDPDYGQARRTPFVAMDDAEEMERLEKQGAKSKPK
jgi:hypothetical protein